MKTKGPVGIAFDDVGDGELALLCLPGWAARRTAFHPLYPDLASDHRVLAVDWRGHGGSDASPGDFGSNELLEDALAVVETANVERIVPVATAHAGWIAIELRKKLGPGRVPAIVLVDWMVLGAPPPFLDGLAALQNEASYGAVRGKLFEMWTTGVSDPAVHAFVAEMGKHDFAMWSRGGREIAASFAKHKSPVSALESLACPTLHAYAQPDDPGYLAAQKDYAAAHPWLEVEKLEARSHFPTIEAPAQVAKAIRRFVSERASRPA